jgi:predicted O-methyltransferase YrrM
MKKPTLSICIFFENGGKSLADVPESLKNIADEIVIINSPPTPLYPPLDPPWRGSKREGGKEEDNRITSNSSKSPLLPVPFDTSTPLSAHSAQGPDVERSRNVRGELKQYEYPWNNDYSALRNFAIEQSTSDWILFLDDNEIVSAFHGTHLREYLNRSDIDIFYLKYIEKIYVKEPEYKFNIRISENKFRYSGYQHLKPYLFRNKPEIRFTGWVFESIKDIKNLQNKTEIADIYISHYNEQILKTEKDKKIINLLKLSLDKDETDIFRKLYLKARLITLRLNDLKPGPLSYKLKEEILKINNEIEAENLEKYFHFWYGPIIDFLINEVNDFKNAFIILNKAINVFPYSLNLLYHLYNLFSKNSKIYESIKVLNLMIQVLESKPSLTAEIMEVDNQLLDKDNLNFLRATANYELCNYDAFEYYFNQIKESDRYIVIYQKLKAGMNRRFQNLKDIEDNILNGEINELNYFRLAREQIRELEYEKALETYLLSLKFSFKNNNIILQQLIFSDLILNAKKLILAEDFINEIIEEGKSLSENYSFYWYALGKYYFSTGYPEKSVKCLENAFKIEKDSGTEDFNINSITSSDSFLFMKIQRFLELVNTSGKFTIDISKALPYLSNKDFKSALEIFLSIESDSFTDYEKYVFNDYLAIIYEWLGDYENSEKLINQSLKIFPDYDLKSRATASSEHKYWRILKKLPAGIMMYQIEYEWIECLKEIDKVKPGVVVEIGTYKGGTLYSIAELIRNDATLVSIDMPGGSFGGKDIDSENFSRLEDEIKKIKPEQKFYSLREDSHKAETKEKLIEILAGKKADVLFIDGDHTYEGVKKDFEMYSPLVKDDGIIIFHDILEHILEVSSQVDQFWKEIIPQERTKEFIGSELQGWAGIGIILKKSEKKIYEKYNLVSVILPEREVTKSFYNDNIKLLSYAFDDLGIEYSYSFNELRKEHNNILFQSQSTTEFSNYILDYTYIPFQMEQLPFYPFHLPESSGYMRLLRGATRIWDFSQFNIQFLNSIGINNVLHLPFAYHQKMEVIDFNKEKTTDILFYGELNQKRVNILNKLTELGYKATALTGVFGEERNRYIEKAKIILNISRFHTTLLEEHRLSFLLNNGCFIISEQIENMENNPFGDGLVFSDYYKIIETCEYYLKPENENLRKKIAEKGYKYFSKSKFTDNLRKVTSDW